jgi:hypothetical protein
MLRNDKRRYSFTGFGKNAGVRAYCANDRLASNSWRVRYFPVLFQASTNRSSQHAEVESVRGADCNAQASKKTRLKEAFLAELDGKCSASTTSTYQICFV